MTKTSQDNNNLSYINQFQKHFYEYLTKKLRYVHDKEYMYTMPEKPLLPTVTRDFLHP